MISIDGRDPRPLYEQVVDGFRQLIVAGALQPDDKLPSVRSLAAQLAINPNTIQRAYRELESLGYVYSTAGRGSFVADSAETRRLHVDELLAQFDEVVGKLEAAGYGRAQMIERLEEGDGR